MFQQIAINFILRALPQIICQLFGYCVDHEDCPDGVCDELFQDCDEFGNCTPEPSATKLQAFDFNPNWEVFTEVVEDARKFLASLRRFLGLTRNVGE